METSDWPFKDPPNVAVFTVGSVMNKALPILLVCHDKEACEWQFLTGGEFSMKEAMLVTLRSVVATDSTIKELADLPCGWEATRENQQSNWIRRKSEVAPQWTSK